MFRNATARAISGALGPLTEAAEDMRSGVVDLPAPKRDTGGDLLAGRFSDSADLDFI